jgi:hypothetical protein
MIQKPWKISETILKLEAEDVITQDRFWVWTGESFFQVWIRLEEPRSFDPATKN